MVKVIQTVEKEIQFSSESLFSQLLNIEQVAWESKFYQVKPKKITASSLFAGFMRMTQTGNNSLDTWATAIGLEVGQTITTEALNNRLNKESCQMAELVLRNAMKIKLIQIKLSEKKQSLKKKMKKVTSLFNNILLRDSTTVKLPDKLREVFKGGFSHTGNSSVARIQALFNFTNEEWLQFKIGSFTDNDQSQAACIENEVQQGDLVLQDLGYFGLDWLEKLTKKAYVITKWKTRTNLFTLEGKKIDLPTLMKNKKSVDMQVLVGSKKRLPMRLVAKKLPLKQAVKRIKEAKKDRHSHTNHSPEYYNMLRYEVYLTNIDSNMLDANDIAKLYGLRWHIEILFKSWKSFSGFKMVFSKRKMKKCRVIFSLYAFLIQYVWIYNVLYQRVRTAKERMKTSHQISTLKYMKICNMILSELFKVTSLEEIDIFIPQILRHSTYNKRKDRQNTMVKFLYVKQLCINKTQT